MSAPRACSPDQALPPPSCAQGETAILVAQSVPSAALVPCFDPLPDGWEATSVDIGDDGTTIVFDSDRAGEAAARFRYAEACDIGAAVDARSALPHTRRFDLIESVTPAFRAQRFFVFEGGCMWWDFDFDDGVTATLSVELGERLNSVTRDDLNDSIRESFIDEEV